MDLKELWNKSRSIISYLFWGVVTTVVNVVVYSLCYDVAHFSNILSTVIAWVVAVAVAFVTNKLFVFDSKSWHLAVAFREMFDFTLCRLGTGVVEIVMMYVLVDVLEFNGTIMEIITNVVVFAVDYECLQQVCDI